MKKLVLYLFLLVLTTYGCTHKVAISSDLEITESVPNQLDFRVGLYIPPELKKLVMSDITTDNIKYVFDVGSSVESIIKKACTRIFSYIEILEAYPTEAFAKEKNLDFFILAGISDANIGLNFQNEFLHTDAKGVSHITATLKLLEKNLNQFTSLSAIGTGMKSETIGAFSSGKDEFAISVEIAIRNLGDNIVQQIYGNYDIRKRAEQKGKSF